jgi:hypothetical protein
MFTFFFRVFLTLWTFARVMGGLPLQCLTLQLRCSLGSFVCLPVGGPLMVAQWLRYCARNRKVAGSIPDGVIGIFH